MNSKRDPDEAIAEQYIQQQEEEMWQRYIESREDMAVSFIKKARENSSKALDKTLEKHSLEISKLIDKIGDLNTREEKAIYIPGDFDTIFEIHFTIWESGYYSIYFAATGHYLTANFLLRQYLEIYLTAMYFDVMIPTLTGKDKTELELQRKDWLEGKEVKKLRFRGKKGVLDGLIDQDTNQKIIDYAKSQKLPWYRSGFALRNHIEDIFSILSRTVHTGILEDHKTIGDVPITPFTYDDNILKEYFISHNTIYELTSLILIAKNPALLSLDNEKWRVLFDFDQIPVVKAFT